jgi:hypothetical protein
VALVTALLSVQTFADDRVPIFVYSTTDDTVGTTYAFQLRERLRSSPGYTLVSDEREAWFVLNVLTLNPDTSANQPQTVAAIALQVENPDGYNYFVDMWELQTGRDRLAEGISDLLSSVDKQVRRMLAEAKATADDSDGSDSEPVPCSFARQKYADSAVRDVSHGRELRLQNCGRSEPNVVFARRALRRR